MLNVLDVTRRFDAKVAVQSVSLTVAAGDVVAVLGPSGCGKSTLLSLIAGLEVPDSGDVRWDGASVLTVPTHLRGFGLMFQDYALFPHRNVFDNVAFGLRMQKLSNDVVVTRVTQALETVGLAGYGRRTVTTLSGGEQQRVAIARALAPRPRVLMLDEPLGALDRALREQLVEEIDQILHTWEGRPAVVYVTHDQAEAMALADRVAVMRAGRIEQIGAPDALVAEPANAFVAEFLGLGTLIPARLVGPDRAETSWGLWSVTPSTAPASTPGQVLIRTDAAAGHPTEDAARLTGRVLTRHTQPLGVRVQLALDGGPSATEAALILRADQAPRVGEAVTLALDPSRLTFLPAA